MAFTGMDIGQVRTLATQLDTGAGEIEALISKLTSVLDGTSWEGPDAVKFRGDWSGAHTQTLRNVAEQLKSTAVVARGQADQQEAASA